MAGQYQLGPSVSLDRGASLFAVGEYVLVRIPEEIQVEGYHIDNEASVVGTDLYDYEESGESFV
ncbi:hypothetical protein F5887DRAFT_970066 [Amanita rubescens]|nr:hypothetical protein F5887DRAFT_970066 [Amanita rubescens]